MPRGRDPFEDFFGGGNNNNGDRRDPFDDFFNHGDFDDIFEQMNREIDEIFGGIFSDHGHNGPGITIINPNSGNSPFSSRNSNNNKPDLSSINPNFSSNDSHLIPSDNDKKQNKNGWFKNPFSRNNDNNYDPWRGSRHRHELNDDDKFRISQVFPWFFSPEKDNNPNINDITSKDDSIHKSPYFPFWNKKEKRLPIENYYNNNSMSTNSDYRYNYTSTVITNHNGNIKKVTTVRDNNGERTIEEVYDENNELQSRTEKGDGINNNLLDNIVKKDTQNDNNNNNTQVIDNTRPTIFYRPFNIMSTFNRFNKKPGEWFWR